MSERRGYSVRIFLPDGDPTGLWEITRPFRTLVGWRFPRGLLPALKGRPELALPGVYLLVGPSETDPWLRVALGGADPLLEGLRGPQGRQGFWTWGVVFTATDESLNRERVLYLAARLWERAARARRAELLPEPPPVQPTLSEADRAEAEAFLEDLLGIFPLLGLSLFEVTPRPAGQSPHRFLLDTPELQARGYPLGAEFVVVKGSEAAALEEATCPRSVQERRTKLQAWGVLVPQGDRLIFTQDCPFRSPSEAAAVILGQPADGWRLWVDDRGRALGEVQSLDG